ncbi:MAG: ATP-binding protein [Candidatus Hamiltonella defensa (Ceratovacuna japonica)]
MRERLQYIQDRLKTLNAPVETIAGTEVRVSKAECPEHGPFEQRCRTFKALPHVQTRTDCPRCLETKMADMQNQVQAEQARKKQALIQTLLKNAHIPPRFEQACFESYQPVNAQARQCLAVCQRYAEHWPTRRAQGGGLVLCGRPGTGKNHLAVSMAKSLIQTHQASVLLTGALQMIRAVKNTWSKTAEKTETQVIQDYARPDLLVIDELGVQFGSDTEKIILFEILNTRYEQLKPSVLISNLAPAEMADCIGERVMDRMQEGGGGTLAFTWDSYRSRGAA